MKTHRARRLSLNPHRAVKQRVSVRRPQTQVSSVSVCGSIRREEHMSRLSQMGPCLGGNTLLTAGVHRGAQTHAHVDRRAHDETRVRLSLAFDLFTRWGCFHRVRRDASLEVLLWTWGLKDHFQWTFCWAQLIRSEQIR